MHKVEKYIVIACISILTIAFVALLIIGILNKDKMSAKHTTTTTTKRTTLFITSKTTSYPEYETELAIFHGESGGKVYLTHIYKIISGHANMGFKYVNETCTPKSWISYEWNCVATKTGQFTWTDDAFDIAKENNAYSYVEVPGDDKTYSIDEFAKRFIMD